MSHVAVARLLLLFQVPSVQQIAFKRKDETAQTAYLNL